MLPAGDLGARAEHALADLLQQSHLLRPDAIEEVFAAAVRPLGVTEVRIYLADLQQRQLESLPNPDGQDHQATESLAIDSTLAGYAFRTATIQHVPAGEGRDGYRVWVPLVDGTERLGLLSLLASDVGEAMLDRYRSFASLAGLMIVAKSGYSDTYARVRRSGKMAVQAELIWGFLVPRTFATDRVLVAATLEPAYEAGGDAFDYSLRGDHLHVSIFDALGHDLAAGLLASVGVASCRSTRRAGGTLPDVVRRADNAIAGQFADIRFVTALLCDLDLTTGLFSWIPCGHPPPLLIRGNKVIKELARRPVPPLGLGNIDTHDELDAKHPEAKHPDGDATAPVYTERLEPGDRVLLYTDGVTEGRSADGTPFGLDRLSDFIIRHSNDGISAPETMRRLNHAISEYQRGRLQDDATIVLVEWLPDHPERNLIP
jgi:Stage II sporulation protein E (SpoIIE)